MDNIQFNDSDGVSTEVILEDFTDKLDGREPNYLLVYNGTVLSSRWFILDKIRTRSGQWRVSLRRDLLADYKDSVLSSTAFIEKGTLSAEDPFIFNDENFTFNQIKTAEYLLKDKTQMPWLVVYYAKTDGEGNPINLQGQMAQVKPADIYLSTPIEEWEFYQYANTGKYILSDNIKRTSGFGFGVTKENGAGYIVQENGNYYTLPGVVYNNVVWAETSITSFAADLSNFGFRSTEAQRTAELTESFDLLPQTILDEIRSFAGKIIHSDNKYYRVNFDSVGKTNYRAVSTNSALVNQLSNFITNNRSYFKITGTPNLFFTINSYTQYLFEIEDITTEYLNEQTNSFIYNNAGHQNTLDAPYNIAVLPYADALIGFDSAYLFTSYKRIAVAAVMNMIEKQGSQIYDAQILPYCPFSNMSMDIDGILQIQGWRYNDDPGIVLTPDANWTPIFLRDGTADTPTISNAQGIIFNSPTSNISFTIEAPNAQPIETDARERKIKILTNRTRICSPNYNGVFEFNRQKNDGLATYEINCTYKPFSPYIHINPTFGGLYGRDFNDQRGLICGGDFSLPIINDQFAAYELQNRNYQKTFQRQIENMETNQKYQRIQNIAGSLSGSLSGSGSGAALGSFVGGAIGSAGGPIGMGIGALAGGLASGGAGIADLLIQEQLFKENRNYSKDMYQMGLQNIKALPDTLARVSSFDIDNKIFPFIEEYNATSEEKQALYGSLYYYGMTIGRIDTIINYTSTTPQYIQANIIRFPELLAIDTHIANEIASELRKGVFI